MEVQDDKRGTGRTTRQLLRALVAALEGKYVYYESDNMSAASIFCQSVNQIAEDLGIEPALHLRHRLSFRVPGSDVEGNILFGTGDHVPYQGFQMGPDLHLRDNEEDID